MTPPPPKIMIIGMKGSGVTTQIQKLSERYKLDAFELKNEFMARKKIEKEKRKRRRQLDRGWKDPPAEPEEVDPDAEPFVDEEIENDPEDFDAEGHEKELMRLILQSQDSLFIDGCWREFGETDGVLALEGPQFLNLLYDSRRVPEIIVFLNCSQAKSEDRMIDKAGITKTCNEKTELMQKDIEKLFEDDKVAKQAEL